VPLFFVRTGAELPEHSCGCKAIQGRMVARSQRPEARRIVVNTVAAIGAAQPT